MLHATAIRILGIALSVVFFCQKPACAAEILVAAASDLNFAMQEIVAEFENRTGQRVKLATGSSGNFYAQIVNGAPFELFLSADLEYARRLEEAGLAEPATLYVYATGRIVIWVPRGSSIDVATLGMQAVLHPSIRRIAIANPRHAPYGRAATAALRYFNLYNPVRARLVYGENVAQAAQFVQSGAADTGIIALSVALSPPMQQAGRYWEIPPHAYPRMEQGMVILKAARSRKNLEAVRDLYDWFIGDYGRRILERYGFFVSR